MIDSIENHVYTGQIRAYYSVWFGAHAVPLVPSPDASDL